MAETKPKGALAIRAEAAAAARETYKTTVVKLRAEAQEAKKQNRELARSARENQAIALQASRENQQLLKHYTEQNSRAAVAATMLLASVVGAGVELGAHSFVQWLAKPEPGDKEANFVLRNLGLFEAMPGFVLGGVTGGIALYRAGDVRTEYGAGDEFLRQLGSGFLTVGMIRAGDALLKPMPLPGK